MRNRLFQIVERAQPGDRVSRGYDYFILAVAFASIVPLMFKPGELPPDAAAALNLFDVVTVYILFFDYLLRWMTNDLRTGRCGWRAFAAYPFRPLAIVELLAILPSLGVLPSGFLFLRALRVVKICRYSKSLTIVANVFAAEKRTLLSVLGVAVAYIFVVALVMFSYEPDTFDDFIHALYWSTTTLTTVGYGDVYPTTDLGRVITMVSSLFGIAMIALPAGIITGGFLEQIRLSHADRASYFAFVWRRREHRAGAPAGKARARTPLSGSLAQPRRYFLEHRTLARYLAVMGACLAVDLVLSEAMTLLGRPLWLDTVGTALAAILLEPAAGLIVGFVNNLVLAVQFGNAGNLLYYALSALAALSFGLLFGRGRRVSARSVALLVLVVAVLGAALSTSFAYLLEGGTLTTETERLYAAALSQTGAPEAAVAYGAMLIDKLLDTAAVFVLVMMGRAVFGKRVEAGAEPGDASVSEAGLGAPGDSPAAAPASPSGSVPGASAGAPDGAAAGAPCSESAAPAPAGASASPAGLIVALDVERERTRAGVFSAAGELISFHAFRTRSMHSDEAHLQVALELGKLMAQSGTAATEVAAVGISVPRDMATDRIFNHYQNFDVDLRAYQALVRAVFPNASRCVTTVDAEHDLRATGGLANLIDAARAAAAE